MVVTHNKLFYYGCNVFIYLLSINIKGICMYRHIFYSTSNNNRNRKQYVLNLENFYSYILIRYSKM